MQGKDDLIKHPPVIMFLAKAFQTDPRPRQEAKSLVEASYPVFVLAWDRDRNFARIENVDGALVRSYHHVRAFSPFLLALGAVVFQILIFLDTIRLIGRLRERPIIHAHDFNTLLPGCIVGLTRLSVALVYDCHEVSYAAYSEYFNHLAGSLVRAVEQLCLRCVDSVITVSPPLAEYLRRFNAATETIYNCPRMSDIPRLSKERARHELGLPADAFIVSSIGTIRYDCRLDLLLAVSALTKKQNIHYVVVGDGPLAADFGQAASQASGTRLTVLPRVPREVALTYVLASDLTWSLYREDPGFLNPRVTIPWKFFESLACGVPVIVEPGTMRAVLVEELECGLVAKSNDPSDIMQDVLRLAGSSDAHQEMCRAARRASARRFNWEAMSIKLCDVYERVTLATTRLRYSRFATQLQ
jgi:glycosyltransferase involved in cell wall biosynthesis